MHDHQLLTRWNLGVMVASVRVMKKCCIKKKLENWKEVKAQKEIVAFVIA
jgi:hypothetical protein